MSRVPPACERDYTDEQRAEIALLRAELEEIA
jgi:hypothetical protein